MSVLRLAAFGEPKSRFFRTEPRGLPQSFIRSPSLTYFHQESFDHEFLHTAGLPEHTLGMNVEMKVAWLNRTQGAGFFRGFPFGRLAMGEACVGRALGEGPLAAAVGVDQQEFDRTAVSSVADGGYLQRQRLRNARRTHAASCKHVTRKIFHEC